MKTLLDILNNHAQGLEVNTVFCRLFFVEENENTVDVHFDFNCDLDNMDTMTFTKDELKNAVKIVDTNEYEVTDTNGNTVIIVAFNLVAI